MDRLLKSITKFGALRRFFWLRYHSDKHLCPRPQCQHNPT